jgi:hypothetical protein
MNYFIPNINMRNFDGKYPTTWIFPRARFPYGKESGKQKYDY